MRLPRRRPPQLMGLLGPESMEIGPRRLRTGDTWCESFGVTGYPREVGPGWLAPLLAYPGRLDVALHVEPVPNGVAAGQLRRQLARIESTRRIDASRLHLPDPTLDVAVRDAGELAGSLARGEGRLFRLGLSFTVWAPSPEALDAEVHKVASLASSLLLDVRPLTFRALEGWIATLPLGLDPLGLRRSFDTRALASCFPFASAEINHGGGVLYGRNASTKSLVFCDRFALENYNQVILARSGAGKSYFAKLMALRSLHSGIEVLVVDPENEYERLARAVGGSVLRLGADGARLNPLDLSSSGAPDALLTQALFVHTVVQTLVGDLSGEEHSLLDAAVLATYEAAGITADPRTHARPAPLLPQVAAALAEFSEGASLARRLAPYVTGSHRGLFDRPTTVRPEGHLVVFSLRDLPEELKAAGTLLALDAIWRRVTGGERRRRIVVVDEAWWLLRSGSAHAAMFLYRLAKSARKHWCGLTTITQDVSDVASSELGQAVITNASSHLLLGQSPQAIETLSRIFCLSKGEGAYLLSCDRGQGLVSVGGERAALEVIASDGENAAVTTDPAELAELEEA